MPNASDDYGYDPIDGKPSVTDSPAPYQVLPDQLKTQPRFLASIGELPYPTATTNEELRNRTGRAFYTFVLGLQNSSGNDIDKAEQQVQKLTDELFKTLESVHVDAFKDVEFDKVALISILPKASPFAIVLGRAKVRVNGSDETVSVDWIVQSITNPTGAYQTMGQLVQIGVSQAMEDLHPGIMDRTSKGELTLDEVINLIEGSVNLPS